MRIGPTKLCRFLAIGLLAALLAVPSLAQSPAPFSQLETPIPDGVGLPFGFGDVNGDGSPDLIVEGAPYVLLNDGHGRFTPAVGSAGYLGPRPLAAIADFDQDGHADLFTVLGSTAAATSSLWLGTAAGTLVAAPPPPGVFDVGSIAAGDVNGDGAPEIVFGRRVYVGGFMGGYVPAPTVVLLNDGNGTFTNVGSLGLPAIGSGAMLFLDFDLDGDQDLAASKAPTGVVIATNNGGTFTVPAGYVGLGSGIHVLLPARLNADAFPDLVLLPHGTGPEVYYGGPSGVTPASIGFPNPVASNVQTPIAVFDLTGDGIDEVLVSDDFGISVYSVPAPGPATVLLRIERPAATLVSRDLDGDADVDLLLLSHLVYTAYFSDGAGGLHRQGPGLVPRWLLGGPIALDLSADGAPELVGTVSDVGGAKLAVAQNDGAGRFSWTTVTVTGAALPNLASLIAAADVDGDGLKDLVLVEGTVLSLTTWNFSVRVVANGGGGLWTAGTAAFIGSGSRFDVEVADLNADGRDDVVMSAFPHGVGILYGSAGGLLAPGALSSVAASRIALFDADGDLDLDIAVAGQPCSLLVNDGSGSFTTDPSFPPQSGSVFVTTADVNGDGVMDVYLNNTLFLHEGASWVQVGTIPSGNGTFGSPGEVRSFDFDFDGDVDAVIGSALAFVSEAAGAVSTHALPIPSGVGYYNGWSLDPVDLDRDGDPDLVGTVPVDNPQNFQTLRMQVVLYNTARHLSQDSPARPGRPLTMGLHGVPGWTVVPLRVVRAGVVRTAALRHGVPRPGEHDAARLGRHSFERGGKLPDPASSVGLCLPRLRLRAPGFPRHARRAAPHERAARHGRGLLILGPEVTAP